MHRWQENTIVWAAGRKAAGMKGRYFPERMFGDCKEPQIHASYSSRGKMEFWSVHGDILIEEKDKEEQKGIKWWKHKADVWFRFSGH